MYKLYGIDKFTIRFTNYSLFELQKIDKFCEINFTNQNPRYIVASKFLHFQIEDIAQQLRPDTLPLLHDL